jgi:hypothetical protein
MSFKDEKWDVRVSALGDEAEGKFEEWCERARLNFERTGWNRPSIRPSDLPTRLRYMPDYCLGRGYIEVQGFGKDQIFKVKLEKLNSLHYWNALHPVTLYVWDSFNERECFVGLAAFDNLLGPETLIKRFPEGKTYLAVPGDLLFLHGSDRP